MSNLPYRLPGDIKSFAKVLYPQESEPPILSPVIRQAVHQWMTEINAREALIAVKLNPRSSCLLSGPPGCGKTTLAHHFAARLGLPLLSLHMDRIRSMYVGATGQNIASLFEFLDENPDGQVIFFDEFDAIAAQRSSHDSGSTREHNAVIGSLLSRIENYRGIMLAATNRAADIDPAIWRRFGLTLEVGLPGQDERFAIVKRYLVPFDLPDDAIALLAASLAGAPPSLIRQLVEGIKRDLVLSSRINLDMSCKAVMSRLRAACIPHQSYDPPPFWSDDFAIEKLSGMAWPPAQGG